MKKIPGILLLIITPLVLHGQDRERLKTQIQAAQHDTTRLRLYCDLSDVYYKSDQYDSMYNTVQRGFRLASQYPSAFLTARLYHRAGLYYRHKGLLEEAMKSLQKALDLFHQTPQKDYPPSLLYHINITYIDQGDFKQAIKQALANLDFYEKQKLSKGIIVTHLLLHNIYSSLGNRQLTQVYLEKYFQLARQSTEMQDWLLALQLRAASYENDKQLARAYTYRQQAVKYARRLKFPYFVIGSLRDVSANLRKQGRPASALPYVQEALQVSIKYDDKPQLALCWQELSLIYLQQGQKQKAFQAAQQAILLVSQSGYTMEVLRVLAESMTVQQATGHYREALQTYQKQIELRDSIYSLEKTKAISRIQAGYDLEKKEHQISLLNKNAQLQALQTGKQQQQLLQLLIGSGSLIVVVGVISFLLYQGHKTRRQLLQQNQLVVLQASELQEANQLKDQLFSIISHDLRSPLASSQYLLKQIQQVSPQAQSWPSLVRQLTSQIAQLSRLVDNLLYWSLAQQGRLYNQIEWLDVSELLTDCESLYSEVIRRKDLCLQVSGLPLQIQADENQFRIILRNVLDNAIKFSPGGGTIAIHCLREPTGVQLQITNATSAQSNTFTGANFGLKAVTELMEQQGGRLTVNQSQADLWQVSLYWPIGATTRSQPDAEAIHS